MRRGPAMRVVLDGSLFQRNRHPPEASATRAAAPASAPSEPFGAAATFGFEKCCLERSVLLQAPRARAAVSPRCPPRPNNPATHGHPNACL